MTNSEVAKCLGSAMYIDCGLGASGYLSGRGVDRHSLE